MVKAKESSDARDVPLEERLRQKKQGFAVQTEGETEPSGPARRANKNQPLELSSKRAVGRFRQVVDVKKRRVLDPRFEAQSGRLNEELFSKSYAFLDEYKQRELQELKQQLKKSKSSAKKEELKVSIWKTECRMSGDMLIFVLYRVIDAARDRSAAAGDDGEEEAGKD
ncbi:hypothetical protein, variant [Phytophthora nicotianae]|uniref:rRNA biogenesis protein RRP36 n=1 Tax=Phytophthora nicotianae TaxID=4792 RepID=W2JAW2_PHYNI|nr:hypothetical protein, variant [Phytophthora nicotianae]